MQNVRYYISRSDPDLIHTEQEWHNYFSTCDFYGCSDPWIDLIECSFDSATGKWIDINGQAVRDY